MGKLVVVKDDEVKGTDKHNVTGNATNPAPPPAPPIIPYQGVADFKYDGKMTDQLSDFVKVDGKPVALVCSESSLNPGENSAPAGKHSGPQGTNFLPPSPQPVLPSLSITDPIGEGKPSVASGSSFVKVNNVKVLLDGDKIDTCDGLGIPGNSTVTAANQDFLFCSE